MKSKASISVKLFVAVFALMISTANAWEVVFTVTERPDNFSDPDASPWLASNPSAILFETEAANILSADEVDTLPGLNENGLGGETGMLNFFNDDTGLGFSFSITADATTAFPGDPATGFTYNDTEGGDIFRTGALSPGDVGNFDDDDVTFRFLDGQDIFAFGFDLLDSNTSAGESLVVYDKEDEMLAEFDLPSGPSGVINNFFLGVSSDAAIGRITFLENTGSDDIAIRDFRFSTVAVPEPTTFALLICSLTMVLSLRRCRS